MKKLISTNNTTTEKTLNLAQKEHIYFQKPSI
jgi:hypothetical protein